MRPALNRGEIDRAEGFARESIGLFREVGDRLNTALVLNCLGLVRHRQGRYQEAKAYYQQAFNIATEMQSLSVTMEALVGIAGVYVQAGAIEPVLELLVHVVNHPASNQRAKDQAEELRVQLEAQLTPQQIQAAHARARAQTFEALIQEILALQ